MSALAYNSGTHLFGVGDQYDGGGWGGSNYADGILDEIRISGDAWSLDYIKLLYDQPLYSFGESENKTETPAENETVASSGNISCVYNTKPFLKSGISDLTDRNKIDWVCNMPNTSMSYECFTYVTYAGELLQANPPEHYVDQTGKIDSFSSNNGIVKAWFLNDDLRDEVTVNFTIFCSDTAGVTSNFTSEVTPQYKDPYVMLERTVYVKDNKGYLIAGIIIFLIVVVLLGWAIKNARGEG